MRLEKCAALDPESDLSGNDMKGAAQRQCEGVSCDTDWLAARRGAGLQLFLLHNADLLKPVLRFHGNAFGFHGDRALNRSGS